MKVKMTVDEALEFADEWVQGMTFHEESQGWRVVCAILSAEVRRLRDANIDENGVCVHQDIDGLVEYETGERKKGHK
jgi:hypothetical protein